jgi:hypothetical protein
MDAYGAEPPPPYEKSVITGLFSMLRTQAWMENLPSGVLYVTEDCERV